MNIDELKKNWFVVMKSSSLKHKPTSVELFETRVVIYRNANEIVALKDQCSHRGIPLSQGVLNNQGLRCRYHGWLYDDNGYVIDIPGIESFESDKRCQLEKYEAIDEAGYVWLRLTPSVTKPYLPDVHTHYSYFTQSMSVKGKLVDILENFLDPMHTHYIHKGLVRSGANSKRTRCHVTLNDIELGYEAKYVEEKRQSGMISSLFGRSISESSGKVLSPCVVELTYRTKLSKELVISIHALPSHNNIVTLFIRTYIRPTKFPFWLKAIPLILFQSVVGYQDKKILNTQAMNKDKDFKPISTKIDFMRPHIINVLNCNLQPFESSRYFIL